MIIFGKNAVEEALKLKKVKKIYLLEKNNQEIINIDLNGLKPEYINRKKMLLLTKNNFNQGIAAEINNIQTYGFKHYFSSNNEISKIVVLDHIQDSQNFGSIIRTCVANNHNIILIPQDRQTQINAFVVKASSGAIFHCDIVVTSSLYAALKVIKEKYGFWLYGASINNDAKKIGNVIFNLPYCLIFGNEHSGISKTINKYADVLFKLNMSDDVNSFNINLSVGITLYLINNYKTK